MPFVRCMWYNPDGSKIGDGCHRLPFGDCQFVHPSAPQWDRAPPSRHQASAPRGRRESDDYSSRGRDGGWARGAQDRRASAPSWNTNNSGARDAGAGTGGWGTKANAGSGSTWDAPKNVSAPAENPFKNAFACPSPRANSPAPTWGSSGWGKTAETSGWGNTAGDADAGTSSSGWGKSLDEANGWGITASDADTLKNSGGSGKAADTTNGWGSTVANAGTSKSSGTWGSTADSGGGGWDTTNNTGSGGGGWGATTSNGGGAGGGWGATSNSGGGDGGFSTNATKAAEQSGWGAPAPVQAAPASSASASTVTLATLSSAIQDIADENEPAHDDEPAMGRDWDMDDAAQPDATSASAGWQSNERAEAQTGLLWAPSRSSGHVDTAPVERQSSEATVVADWTMADATPRLQAADKEKWAARDVDKPQEPRGRPEALKARSRTSSRRTSPTGFVRAVRQRSLSPELPDGPVKAVKALSNAVRFYVAWDEARDAYTRRKRLDAETRYERVGPLARDKLKSELRRSREECAETEQRRDEALRALRSLWPRFGPAGRAEMTEGGEAANPLMAEFKLYAAEVDAWLKEVRPLVEGQRPQRALDGATRDAQASGSAVRPRAPLDAHLLDFLNDAMGRIEKMDTKVRELEDYQEGLRTDAKDAFDRVETFAGPYPPPPSLERLVPPQKLQRHEEDVATMRDELSVMCTEVVDLAQSKGATRLDLQRLRLEQEQLKLKMLELEETDNAARREMDEMSRGLSQAKATLARLQAQPRASRTAPPAPPPPAPGPVFNPEEIVAALLPDLVRASREDINLSLQHLRAGFENAVMQQNAQLCDQVWQLLKPVLTTVHLIKKNAGLAGGPLDPVDSAGEVQSFSM